MSVVLVVGDLDPLEGDLVGHPVLATGRGVGVNVLEHLLAVGVGAPHDYPLGVQVLVAVVVGWVHLQ